MSWTMDVFGNAMQVPSTTGMMVPVQCTHCGKVYDLTRVHVIARYQDCSVYPTPCCNRQADDRKWKSLPDFRELKKARDEATTAKS
ncbi:MAG: hypothetical protein NUW01_02325 [Gemmatimonadaceae bacterium]|nr:hypothetical protein [Gemmatimonadaceae bacterium]